MGIKYASKALTREKGSTMKHPTTKLATLAITLALAAMPLAACGNTGGTGTEAESASSSAAASQDAKLDMSAWTTLGDAIAQANPQDVSYGYNDKLFVCVLKSDNAYIRTVSPMDPAIDGKFADLDIGADDYVTQFGKVAGGLKLTSAEDITATQLSQDELSGLVGKTGKELIDDGFVFDSYSFYGGEETGADMGKGYFSYSITFDTKTEESQTEDGGASIMDAKVTAAEGLGNLSNAALDPEQAS